MKPPREMTLAEVEYLFHVHEFPAEAERVRALAAFIEMVRIIDFIEERIAATPSLPCDCFYCEEIRGKSDRPPKTPPAVKKKDPPVTFSLD